MSRFLDPFRGEQTGWAHGRPVWTTLAPLRYQSDRLGAIIILPSEFVTDLASVPRLPFLWLAVGGRGTRSAALHDFPYQFGFWWLFEGDRWQPQYVSRKLVDAVYFESLLADPISGAGPVRAREMWAGVRVGGRGVWQNGRASDLNPIWSSGGWETP